jgi:membrane protease YdiL (CAAX protease family)
MTLQGTITQKSWQKQTWVQWLAVAIGVLPYTIVSFFPVRIAVNLKVTLLSILSWSSIIIILLLLLRFLCGERLRDLNLRAGTWWKDILIGIGLSAITLTLLLLTSEVLTRLVPQRSLVVRSLFTEVFQNPWLFALWIGPGILSAAGIGEELLRAFVLSRLWKLTSSKAWRWITVLSYAVLFGLGHIYQGPQGMIMAGVYSLFMSAYYLRFGRFTAMVVGHYLHDVVQFTLLYVYANM